MNATQHIPAALPAEPVLDAIYGGALEAQPWRDLVEILREQFRAADVTLMFRAPTAESRGTSVHTDRMSATGRDAYDSHFFAADGFVDLPLDTVITPEEVIGQRRWHESRIFRQFMAPAGITRVMGADVAAGEDAPYRLRVARAADAGSFSDADRDLCQSVVPHLKRALRLRRRCVVAGTQHRLYASAVDRLGFGAVHVAADGTVLSTSCEAHRILDEGDGLSVRGGHLHVQNAQESRELLRNIRDVAADVLPVAESLLIARPSGRASFGAAVRAAHPGLGNAGSVARLQRSVILFLRDPERPLSAASGAEKAIRQLFNLSDKESRLALALADGLSIDEAADRCGISWNTARSYLRVVYLKTGVHRETALVRLLLNNIVSLASDSLAAVGRLQ